VSGMMRYGTWWCMALTIWSVSLVRSWASLSGLAALEGDDFRHDLVIWVGEVKVVEYDWRFRSRG